MWDAWESKRAEYNAGNLKNASEIRRNLHTYRDGQLWNKCHYFLPGAKQLSQGCRDGLFNMWMLGCDGGRGDAGIACEAGNPLPLGPCDQLPLSWTFWCLLHYCFRQSQDSTSISHPLIHRGKSSPRGHQMVPFGKKLNQKMQSRKSTNAVQPLLNTLSKENLPST